jgi:hypothetical protein
LDRFFFSGIFIITLHPPTRMETYCICVDHKSVVSSDVNRLNSVLRLEKPSLSINNPPGLKIQIRATAYCWLPMNFASSVDWIKHQYSFTAHVDYVLCSIHVVYKVELFSGKTSSVFLCPSLEILFYISAVLLGTIIIIQQTS